MTTEAPKTSAFQYQSDAFTLIVSDTGQTSDQIYTGDPARWTYVTFEVLTGGGSVAVGFKQNIAPPQRGSGRQLLLGSPLRLTVAPGQRVYYAADSTQRVGVTVEPVPWAQQILLSINQVAAAIGLIGKPAAAAAAVAKATGKTIAQLAAPLARKAPDPVITPPAPQRPPAQSVVAHLRKLGR